MPTCSADSSSEYGVLADEQIIRSALRDRSDAHAFLTWSGLLMNCGALYKFDALHRDWFKQEVAPIRTAAFETIARVDSLLAQRREGRFRGREMSAEDAIRVTIDLQMLPWVMRRCPIKDFPMPPAIAGRFVSHSRPIQMRTRGVF